MSFSEKNVVERVHSTASNVSIVKATREVLGYSVEDLALTCGLTVQEIIDLENGTAHEKAKLRRIAVALKLPEDILIRD